MVFLNINFPSLWQRNFEAFLSQAVKEGAESVLNLKRHVPKRQDVDMPNLFHFARHFYQYKSGKQLLELEIAVTSRGYLLRHATPPIHIHIYFIRDECDEFSLLIPRCGENSSSPSGSRKFKCGAANKRD